ncbi:hypothetical protein N0V93_007507 [Gnomoniopsis smithogilvyi]|uniref:Uncharacterized protein n=1 Tax=Gnomoniopsis smithogilvyi TaxID=1191159 RepID=A0A9W9CVR2_9PEZI|nr:hypothetical protein N0V93_007507 [Gnomoniopsis smithogilvyi]
MVGVKVIDPLLTTLGSTGVISLSDEGIKQYQWAQKHRMLKVHSQRFIEDLADRFTARVRATLRLHGFDKAGYISTKQLADLVNERDIPPSQILGCLGKVLLSTEKHLADLRVAYVALVQDFSGSYLEFIDHVNGLKDTIIRPIFSVYLQIGCKRCTRGLPRAHG